MQNEPMTFSFIPKPDNKLKLEWSGLQEAHYDILSQNQSAEFYIRTTSASETHALTTWRPGKDLNMGPNKASKDNKLSTDQSNKGISLHNSLIASYKYVFHDYYKKFSDKYNHKCPKGELSKTFWKFTSQHLIAGGFLKVHADPDSGCHYLLRPTGNIFSTGKDLDQHLKTIAHENIGSLDFEVIQADNTESGDVTGDSVRPTPDLSYRRSLFVNALLHHFFFHCSSSEEQDLCVKLMHYFIVASIQQLNLSSVQLIASACEMLVGPSSRLAEPLDEVDGGYVRNYANNVTSSSQ